MNFLTVPEQTNLEKQERIVERTLGSFRECGAALSRIKQSKLYREYGTFEVYCRERWGMGKSNANRLMGASSVMGNLETSPIGEVLLPSNENQVRPLTRLKEPSDQVTAWKQAVEIYTNPTGEQVKEVVKEMKDEKRKQTIDLDATEYSSLPPTDDENCIFKDDRIQLWHSVAQDLYFIPDDSIDLIVTSPPYNIGRKTGNGRILWGGVAYGDDQDAMPEDEYQESQLLALAEMWRVARPGASLFYNHKVRNRKGIGLHPLEWLLKTEWTFRQEITWDRGSTHNHEMTYFWPVTELVFWLTKGTQDVYLSPEGAEMTTVWRFNFKTNTDHPAPFPQELPARCIRAASKRGDTVLDPFGGSMTTCFMANQLGRLSIGVDRNREYLTKAALRCSQKVLL